MATNGTADQQPTFEIPKECKAGVVVNEGPNYHLETAMVPVPQPGPDEVLIKLNATGLCQSDLHYMANDWNIPSMASFGVRSAGHEGAGVIVKIGDNVKHLKVGDRAGLKPIWDTCGACELCWGDKECYCSKSLLTGLAVPGTYQQYVVSPAKYTTTIPDGVDDFIAGPIMCSAATILTSIKESGLVPGDYAVFPGGGGGVGIQGVMLAAAMGMHAIVVDTGAEKKKLALSRGASSFVDFKEVKDVAEEIKQICDGVGAHGVFVTAPGAYPNAISYVGNRVGAKIMCIGLPPAGAHTIGADPSLFAFKKLTISGTLVGSMKETDAALQFARRGKLKPIYTVYPFEKFPEAVEKLRRGEVAGRIVIDFNS